MMCRRNGRRDRTIDSGHNVAWYKSMSRRESGHDGQEIELGSIYRG